MKNRLKDLRTEAGLTQADLAARLNVSRQAVIAIESDKHDPSLDLAYRIAAIFDLAVEAIFENPHRLNSGE
ncbi:MULTISPECIES: helix-turn-helix transcriptional regulator [Asticcacaulis]|jgi:putative transcriptional regulator|uniref:Transcriptional regulator, XRE family n=2 Tax=Asticcacaulis excentricus TaxID=78587 RepID=E8RPU1_ASTEC|nr:MULTISPECIES: helix-turn-helix transcriptional regulator [Asticcacaulis]ADU13114.1 transcriptional regulator, XRE family [Asticcacaulis excentricus CB 48]MCA1936963.1 helix-turn-helix transcriptional regulator [Asticcacaulis sp.]BBF80213.1 transcriptional regulator, XRE family [Asticcacaulis excentricus]